MMLARDVYKFYRGANHEEMTELDHLLRRDEHWSDAVMGFDQVELRLGELRRFARCPVVVKASAAPPT